MLFLFRTKMGKNLVYVRCLRRLSPFPSLKWIEQRDVRTFVPVRDTSFSTENIPTLEIVYRWWERMRMQDSYNGAGTEHGTDAGMEMWAMEWDRVGIEMWAEVLV